MIIRRLIFFALGELVGEIILLHIAHVSINLYSKNCILITMFIILSILEDSLDSWSVLNRRHKTVTVNMGEVIYFIDVIFYQTSVYNTLSRRHHSPN